MVSGNLPVTFSFGDESYEEINKPEATTRLDEQQHETTLIFPPSVIHRSNSTPHISSPLASTNEKIECVIDVDPINDEAERIVQNGYRKFSNSGREPKKSILSNLLQLHQFQSKRSETKSSKKTITSQFSSQSLQLFFGKSSRRSSVSDDLGLRCSRERSIAAAIEAILKRQKFIKDLCHALISYGAPSHRLESNMQTISRILNVDASFASLPGLMLISFSDYETHTSETVLLRVDAGYDMYKLDAVVSIYQRMVKEDLGLFQADEELQSILNSPPLYPPWVELLSYGVGAFSVAPLFFNGSWMDAAVAGVLGLFVGLMTLLSRLFSSYSHLFELITSVSCAFIATALQHHVCYWSVVLSATVNLLPGLSLTTAVMDLASKNMVSGSVRLFYALVSSFMLGFGLSLGVKLYSLVEDVVPNNELCQSIPFVYKILLFIPTSVSFNIFLLAHPRQWGSMLLVAFLAFLSNHYMPIWVQYHDIVPAISAVIIGLASNLYARLTDTLPIVPLLGSILLLVPGSISVKGSAAILDSQSAEGSHLAVQMIVTAMSITVGLFASTMVIFPLGRRRSAFMTF